MSKLKVNEIEDNSGGTVRVASNVNVEGDSSAAKNLTVSGCLLYTSDAADE